MVNQNKMFSFEMKCQAKNVLQNHVKKTVVNILIKTHQVCLIICTPLESSIWFIGLYQTATYNGLHLMKRRRTIIYYQWRPGHVSVLKAWISRWFQVKRAVWSGSACHVARTFWQTNGTSTFTTLWANSVDNKWMIFFLFFPWNRHWPVMQNVSKGGILLERSEPIFWDKIRKLF